MRILSRAALIALLSISSVSFAQQIRGDYMESRSTDVYVAQCFANGETGLNGKQALLAWKIDSGSWDGVKLDGLHVAGAVTANATLGDPYGNPYPAKVVMMVDDRATPAQRNALVAFAQHEAGELFDHVVSVKSVAMELELPDAAVATAHVHGSGVGAHAMFRAGNLARIETRTLNDNDHICGNETTYYPPLTTVDRATPAVAVNDEFRGEGLNTDWANHGRRSAYLAHFTVENTVASAGR
jgi:uncharacterized protein DUF1326